MQLKYIVPNGVTAMSMVIGLASIVCSAMGDYRLAAWMILWGVLLDKLDGGAARLLNATSSFGAEMDSFADFVSFGIAPGALIYFRLRGEPLFEHHSLLLMGCCAMYVVAVSARLARFNITDPPGGSQFFFGIPTTLCGALVSSGFLSADIHLVPAKVWAAMPLLLAVMAVLMVSNVRLPKFQKRKNRLVNLFQNINVVAVYVVTPLMVYPQYLFLMALAYLVFGTVWAMANPVHEDDAQLEEQTTSG
jgi:CDP-diacylglycerol--serine O-phosphatidyltransferase